ncbi:class I SAM-dependent methyltransferase [Flavobacterium olei]|uniref:class I SAM-dependent methyltransferase n=1 Tax=Flavobacterium olei TaxID=1886782 RepID=UPI003218EF23
MKNNIEKYIDDWFINLRPDILPASFFIIRKTLLFAISELKPKLKGKVVDLGCGVMPYKNFLKDNSIEISEYIGIDLEPTEYHHAVKPDVFWNGIEIPLESASVDFLFATEFLEHYYDTNHILKEIRRVLKPGGTFFFTVPNIWPLHEVPYDYHRFTPYALEKHFQESGFSSSEIKPLGGFHCHLALSVALWNDFKLSKKKQKLLKPFIKFIIKILMNKDKKDIDFNNNQLYSGLYGFVTN